MPDPTPRERLADLILDCQEGGMSANETADHLHAAGVRPPARVVEDPAELEALPMESIVLAPNGVGWQMTDRDYDDSAIWEAGTSGETSASLLAGGPVTVLHTPENGDR